ncbi:MAG: sigma-54 factor interaction domain-containing protein, partial [Planctomycetota bacterium]
MLSVDQLSDALFEKIATREIVERLNRISGTDVTVLIQGEDGTGKGLVAEAIHCSSARRSARFAVVNCSASNETALESQLFGHVRGAFADALTERVGSFEHAHGGTLLLDDLGDMPLPTQGKLLQALENGEIIRLGSNDAIEINVRVIAATNRGLERDVEAGTFRSDLYHALRVVVIRLPALVGRSTD